MRILGFSKKDWINYNTSKPKLQEPKFTTFRFPRRDKDWRVGELVQIVYKPRRKGGGERLGIAEIVNKEPRNMVLDIIGKEHSIPTVIDNEVKADGFEGYWVMWHWLFDKPLPTINHNEGSQIIQQEIVEVVGLLSRLFDMVEVLNT